MNTYTILCRIRFTLEPVTVVALNESLARVAAQAECRRLYGQGTTYMFVKSVTPVAASRPVPGDT